MAARFGNPFRHLRRWTSLQSLVQTLPLAQLAPLAAAIFTLFSILGPVTDVIAGARQPAVVVLGNTLLSGAIALGYAFGSMRRNWWLLGAAIALQIAWIASVGLIAAGFPLLAAERVPGRMKFDGVLTLLLVVSSYSCFLWFINRTAARYLRAQAEIVLAREIHRVLVPAVRTTIDGFEFAGFSIPSGEVGGDLVDVVSREDGWIGYVADVSGHGVSSGLVMGMFKSALHMRLLAGGTLASLLQDLNRVLVPLKQSSMFVTLACVRLVRGGPIEFAVAGHLPILCFKSGAAGVEESTTHQMPSGMFDDYQFSSSTLECAPGDLLVILTDGLIEVFDGADHELGLEEMKRTIAESASASLETIGARVVARSRAHGTQIDDQTLLLIRKT